MLPLKDQSPLPEHDMTDLKLHKHSFSMGLMARPNKPGVVGYYYLLCVKNSSHLAYLSLVPSLSLFLSRAALIETVLLRP